MTWPIARRIPSKEKMEVLSSVLLTVLPPSVWSNGCVGWSIPAVG
jgi:hypothetical protein